MNTDPDTSKNDAPTPEPPAAARKSRGLKPGLAWALIGGAWGLLALVALGIFLIVRQGRASQAAAVQTPTRGATSVHPGQTATALAHFEETGRAISQATAHARSSATAEVRQSTQTAQALGYFGPQDGALEHDPTDKFVVAYSSGVSLRNFIVEVTFINPYDSHTVNGWDYGIYFRSTGANSQYRVSVFSDSGWHFQYVNDPDWTPIGSGYSTAVNLDAGEKNHLYLKVENGSAEFRINDVLIAKLNVGQKLEAGDILITTENFSGNSVEGYSTEYEDFRIEPLP